MQRHYFNKAKIQKSKIYASPCGRHEDVHVRSGPGLEVAKLHRLHNCAAEVLNSAHSDLVKNTAQRLYTKIEVLHLKYTSFERFAH